MCIKIARILSSFAIFFQQIDGDSGNQMTNRELLEKSVNLARILQKQGLESGDRICVACKNRMDWFIPILATLYIGGICVPYNPAYTECKWKC